MILDDISFRKFGRADQLLLALLRPRLWHFSLNAESLTDARLRERLGDEIQQRAARIANKRAQLAFDQTADLPFPNAALQTRLDALALELSLESLRARWLKCAQNDSGQVRLRVIEAFPLRTNNADASPRPAWAKITLGLARGYSNEAHDLAQVGAFITDYLECNEAKWSISLTPTEICYTSENGACDEAGVEIGLINDPRAPLADYELALRALLLADRAIKEFGQHRLCVSFPDAVVMLEAEGALSPHPQTAREEKRAFQTGADASNLDDSNGLARAQLTFVEFGIGSRPPRDATFSACLLQGDERPRWRGWVPNALRFTVGVPSCGKHPHMVKGMKNAAEKGEWIRTFKADELWPEFAGSDTLLLTRPNQAALLYRGELVSLRLINSPKIAGEDSWRYLWSSDNWIQSHVTQHWRPYQRATLDEWHRCSPDERFWNSITVSGMTKRQFRAGIQAIRVLFSRFCAEEYVSSQEWPSTPDGNGKALLSLVDSSYSNRLLYKIHRFFYEGAAASVRLRAVLRLWALLWAESKSFICRDQWLGADIDGLRIATKDIKLPLLPLTQRASAHETIEAIQIMRVLLGKVPAAIEHLQTLNRSDDENDAVPPIAYPRETPDWTPRQTVMDYERKGDCSECAHHRQTFGGGICAAFPEGVPVASHLPKFKHSEPLEGDGGVRFEPEDLEI